MRVSTCAWVLSAIGLVFGATPAAAEPVRITTGSLTLDITELPYASFNLPELGFQGLFGTPARSDGPCRQPCAPGTLVDASLSVALRDGATNRLLEGHFASGQIQVPTGFGGGSSPFMFEGRLQCEATIPDCVELDLVGSGSAQMLFRTTGQFLEATYTFTHVDPVPEPGSFVLVAAGICALLPRRTRKRTSPRRPLETPNLTRPFVT